MTVRSRPVWIVELLCSTALVALFVTPTLAQDGSMNMPSMPPPANRPASPPPKSDEPPDTEPTPSSSDDGGMQGMTVDSMNMPGMDMAEHMMAGATESYSMMRDASGTAWQPDSTPMEGLHSELWGWSTMLHGYITAVHDHQAAHAAARRHSAKACLWAWPKNSLESARSPCEPWCR